MLSSLVSSAETKSEGAGHGQTSRTSAHRYFTESDTPPTTRRRKRPRTLAKLQGSMFSASSRSLRQLPSPMGSIVRIPMSMRFTRTPMGLIVRLPMSLLFEIFSEVVRRRHSKGLPAVDADREQHTKAEAESSSSACGQF